MGSIQFVLPAESSADSEARFHALFDAAPLAIGIVRDGSFLYANPSLALLVGVSHPAQLLGMEAREFIDPPHQKELADHARARMERGGGTQGTPYETVVRRADGELVPVRTEISPIALSDGVAFISFAFDLSSERRANDEIHALLEREKRSGHFARQLQKLTQALADASSTDEVALIAVDLCAEAVEAVGIIFVMPCENDEGETVLCLSQSRGYSAESVAGWSQMSLKDPTPVAHAFNNSESIWVSNVTDPLLVRRFPVLEHAHISGTESLVALPLLFDMRVVGVLGLTFDTPRAFDPEERVFMETLAASCAQALERARWYTESRTLARRQRESLALLNTLLDSAPVGFALFDRDHRYVLVNEELARIDEFPIENHIGYRPTEMAFDDGAIQVEEFIEKVWTTGVPSGEIEFIRGTPKDEDFRYCILSLFPIRVTGVGNQEGEMLGVGATLIEQNERRRGEAEREELVAQLRTERARFEAILQQMPSGVLIVDAKSGQMILRNEQATEIWGQSVSGWETRNDQADNSRRRGFHIDGRELESDEWPLSRAVAGEVVRGAEVVIERGNGEIGVVRANAAPIRSTDGAISAGIVVFDNITERARAEAAQRFLAEAGAVLVSELDEVETFRAIAYLCVPRVASWCAFVVPETRTTLGVAALVGNEDADSRSTQALETFLRRTSTIHRKISDVMTNQRGEVCPAYVLEAITGDGSGFFDQLEIRDALIVPVTARGRSTGAMVWFNTNAAQSFDSTALGLAEELARRVGLSADNARLLHEAQQARDAAQRARDEAEAANRAKDEFLAVVSHELRTPLTPILGWLELLRSSGIEEELRSQAYDVIERNAIAQAQLVNDILDVSRITTGKLRLELKDLILDDAVKRSVESLRTIWGDKKLKVEMHIERGLYVRADDNRIGQVVWNLLQNAIKFTPAGGEISISLRKVVRTVGGPLAAHLEIRDTGAGIDPQFLPHVFERFRQGDSSSTRKAGGLGLGLAIVRHIVEMHGGQVGVESQGIGMGSTFWVELPMYEIPPTSIPFVPATSRVIGGKLQGIRVLVVDDEPDAREMLARLLEEAGATVRVAPGGRSALEIMPQFGPMLVVSDIGMPEMDGLQLRRELTERGFNAPAIALTAYASSKDELLTKEAGFERYLTKPIGTQELIDVAANLLAST